MINAFFVICENGTPLYIHGQDENGSSPDTVLLSGFLSSINTFAVTLQKTRISQIQLDTKTYYYALQAPIIAILEAEAEDEVEGRMYQILANRLARAFIERYTVDAINNWCGDLTDFLEFGDIFEDIRKDTTMMLKQGHKDFVTEYFVSAASDENIKGMVVFDLEKDETIASDIPRGLNLQDIEAFGSMLFSFIDRLAMVLKTGGINEILIRAQKYWIGGFRKGDLAVFMLFEQDYFGKVLPEFVSGALDDNSEVPGTPEQSELAK